MLLKDKVVIVSGIGPGLGIKLAVEAARAGARAVVCAARTPAKLDAAEAAIRALGVDCAVLKAPTDINNLSHCQRLADTTMEHFGRIDALINSAFQHGEFESVQSTNFNAWVAAFNTNTIGTLTLSQEVIRHMKTQENPSGGAIVMISTMATHKPYDGEAGYAASKGALEVAVKYLAREVGQYGIRVNSVCMGWMWGAPVQQGIRQMARHSQQTEAQVLEKIVANIPLGHMNTDDDCAKAALMLASDYARAITGASLDANGGEYMR